MPRPRRAMSEINVVPYIDVMLVLLVIFMITAPLVNPGVIELPSVGKSSLPPELPLELELEPAESVSVVTEPANVTLRIAALPVAAGTPGGWSVASSQYMAANASASPAL